MLYNNHLDTFIRAADEGSFSKAAEKMFITPAAVMKQIDRLEAELDIKLFTRTNHGLELTPAGRSLYHDARYMQKFSSDAMSRALRPVSERKVRIRLGSSLLNKTDYMATIWEKLHAQYPEIELHVVSFELEPEHAQDFFHDLGYKVDVVLSIFDEPLLNIFKCKALQLKTEVIRLAVPMEHEYIKNGKTIITMDDLKDQDVMMLEQGWISGVEKMVQDMVNENKNIHVEDFDFFDIRYFNESHDKQSLIMTFDDWANVHPLMKVLPFEKDYEVPYGLMYSRHPSPQVRYFIEAMKAVMEHTD